MHRDIRPENIYIRDPNNLCNFCIANFGFADFIEPD